MHNFLQKVPSLLAAVKVNEFSTYSYFVGGGGEDTSLGKLDNKLSTHQNSLLQRTL